MMAPGVCMFENSWIFHRKSWLYSAKIACQALKRFRIYPGRRLAFDFHHIDLDVELDKLRGFGKGPSPKKKVCYNGFRPHIAWDIETGTVIVTEFRKASHPTGHFHIFDLSEV